ncbi:MAG TPA: hypothetical protein VII08_18465, partial [Myxococcales bacterium]
CHADTKGAQVLTTMNGSDKPHRLSREEENALIKRAQAGDQAAKGKLLAEHEGFVRDVVNKAIQEKRFRGVKRFRYDVDNDKVVDAELDPDDYEDLVHESRTGLIEAIKTFNTNLPYALLTYAKSFMYFRVRTALNGIMNLPSRRVDDEPTDEAPPERVTKEPKTAGVTRDDAVSDVVEKIGRERRETLHLAVTFRLLEVPAREGNDKVVALDDALRKIEEPLQVLRGAVADPFFDRSLIHRDPTFEGLNENDLVTESFSSALPSCDRSLFPMRWEDDAPVTASFSPPLTSDNLNEMSRQGKQLLAAYDQLRKLSAQGAEANDSLRRVRRSTNRDSIASRTEFVRLCREVDSELSHEWSPAFWMRLAIAIGFEKQVPNALLVERRRHEWGKLLGSMQGGKTVSAD